MLYSAVDVLDQLVAQAITAQKSAPLLTVELLFIMFTPGSG